MGWKDGEGLSGAGSSLGSEEDGVVVEVAVVNVDEVSVEEDDDDDDDDVDVDVAELSLLVDEGDGPFPATLFGHR